MRILMICHDHPAFTAGGTEHAAHDLCTTLDAMPGISARFLAVTTALTHPDIAPGTLHGRGPDLLLRTGRYDLLSMRRHDGTAWIAAIGKVLEMTAPDVVHLHGLDRIGAEIVPVLKRLRPSVRLVLTLHDYQLICPNEGLLLRHDGGLCARPDPDACRRCFPAIPSGRHALRKAHLQRILSQIDAFVAPSRDLRQRFVDWGLPAGRIAVLPNAVAGGAPRPARDRSRPDRFAFFGNMARHKGTGVLLDAARRLRDRGAELRVSLHGQLLHAPDAATAALAAALEQAAPLAQHLGPYDRSEVPELMAQCDWVVVPSLWFENAPLVVLEARRAGRPVICSAVGGLSELVRDDIDGLHVPRGDAAALAETMAAVAGDRALWSRLAAAIVPPPEPGEAARRHLDLYAPRTASIPA